MEYNEDSDNFKILTIIHVKYAGIFCGLLALTGFTVFLISGASTHYLILHAIHYTQYRLLLPSILFHAFLIGLNTVLCLIAIGELVSDQEPSTVDDSEAAARYVLIVLPVTTCFNSLILIALLKCRHYLRCKRRHIRNGQPPTVREVLHPGSAPPGPRVQKVHPTQPPLVQQVSISSNYKHECAIIETQS
ncbi:hypothetical protein WR25_05038 [Diploscapter pachys]|uniref:Uncharacterized protein n=1 Tax=Diploscapter pachys TaxID=2018661 RepID=A0A2A2J5M5_9BILA|nr:hypothetical protein WR25_05038 [Diploscapter pachys]